MSRADKTQTAITYDLILDETNERLQALEVTILCAMRDRGAGVAPQAGAGALEQLEHVAFKLVYRFRAENGVERFAVPTEAAQLLR